MDLKTAKDEVIYKVGRNVQLFQQMEHLLKYLVANGSQSAYFSQLKPTLEKRQKVVSRKTLGMVVGDFLDNSKPVSAPDNLQETYVTFGFSYEINATHKTEIETLVSGRNHLVHHFFNDIVADSAESWQKAANTLDKQKERLDKEIAILSQVSKALSDGRMELAKFIMTQEFREQLRKDN